MRVVSHICNINFVLTADFQEIRCNEMNINEPNPNLTGSQRPAKIGRSFYLNACKACFAKQTNKKTPR